ncbi:MAG: glycosyltransferase [Anaerolineales bacterium]
MQIALARWALSRHSQLILYSWQNILRQRRLPVRLLSQLTLRAAQHIFCASHEAITVLRRQGYRGGANVVPLFGLDTRYFFPRQANRLRTRLGLNGFGVGYVGRLVPEKGLETLLRAVAQTPARVQLLCLGDGPEQGQLQALTQQLGIADRCQFRGAVVYDQVAEYLNALDLMVLPSRTTRNWKEQFGRVLVEAMACKVVVAGSDSGAIPEVVGNAGRIFPEGDANALAAIITELAADPALRQTLAERGYQRVMGNFTVERYAEVILEVWRKLAS